MNRWTWACLVVIAAVFGFWQKSIAAGIFMLLFLALLTTLSYAVVDGLIGVGKGVVRIEKLLHERLEDPTGGCSGSKDCPCWWRTEQQTSTENK